MRRTPEDEVRRKVTEVARMLRIDDKLANAATKLSGGQMQRVAIGRALVREPAVTLMDEPLSSLDAKLRNDLRLELKRIQQDLGATMLYVTHDQTEAMTLATRIGVLERECAGPGRDAAADLPGPGEQLRRGASGIAAHQPAAGSDRPPAGTGCGGHGRRAARRHAPDVGQRARQRPCAGAGASHRAPGDRSECTWRSVATPRWKCSRCAATPAASSRVARCRWSSPRHCSSTPPASASRAEPGTADGAEEDHRGRARRR